MQELCTGNYKTLPREIKDLPEKWQASETHWKIYTEMQMAKISKNILEKKNKNRRL